MKKTAIILGSLFAVLVLVAVILHAFPIPNDHGHLPAFTSLHGDPHASDEMVTVQLNPPGMMTCGQPFFDSIYQETKAVFAVGVDNVVLSQYEDRIFALIRNSDEFKDDPEPFIDHVKDVMRQTIDIVRENPAVLDSCGNFQVAMVGPR